jgi:hypothetical protein
MPGLRTINPAMPPTVDEFRKVFPEFADVSDEQVQFYLDQGMLWIDTYWEPIDAKLGAMYAAAHFLTMQNISSGGVIINEGGSDSGGSTPSDPEVGKIWVKTVRFRDRMVSYERVGTGNEKTQSGNTATTASDDYWQATLYGQMYLSYRRRNVPHVAVV